MNAIRVQRLGKAYRQYNSRWARLAEWLDPRGKSRHREHWVLRDVTFTLGSGEAVGIIGMNGAGKSTLLKLITGTTQPTAGTVQVHGRVAALLELGMGFHSDFTGRQNAFMAGQLLGYSADEIAARMQEIESFAEIGEYIDQPVRVYSSGMQVRLAFSVATAYRPEVLIVDEALSVGDAYFQHKSFERIREFRRLGTTLLLVSHDKQAIQSLCDRAILLHGGQVAMQGVPEAVMDLYNAMLADHQSQRIRQSTIAPGRVQTVSGNGEAVIEDVLLMNEAGEAVEVVNVGQVVQLEVRVRVIVDIPELVVGYMIKDRLGQIVFGTNSFLLHGKSDDVSAGRNEVFRFEFAASLGEGNYSISVAAHASDSHVVRNYEWRDLALMFDVVNFDKQRFVGTAWLPARLERLT